MIQEQIHYIYPNHHDQDSVNIQITISQDIFRFHKDLITPDYSSSNCCGNEITFVIGMETPIFSFWMPTASSFCASFLRSTCFWMAIYSSLRGIATCTYLNDCKKLLSIQEISITTILIFENLVILDFTWHVQVCRYRILRNEWFSHALCYTCPTATMG